MCDCVPRVEGDEGFVFLIAVQAEFDWSAFGVEGYEGDHLVGSLSDGSVGG